MGKNDTPGSYEEGFVTIRTFYFPSCSRLILSTSFNLLQDDIIGVYHLRQKATSGGRPSAKVSFLTAVNHRLQRNNGASYVRYFIGRNRYRARNGNAYFMIDKCTVTKWLFHLRILKNNSIHKLLSVPIFLVRKQTTSSHFLL